MLGIPEFQFHKGAIRTNRCRSFPSISRDFNSIKVRLERRMNQPQRIHVSHFNSIKVRLEQGEAVVDEKDDENFNSIKVRLEHVYFATIRFSF